MVTLNNSFWNCIASDNNTDNSNKSEEFDLNDVEKAFNKAFSSVGYVSSSDKELIYSELSSTDYPWKVEICASASYAAIVRLSSDMKSFVAHERALMFVNATLLSGGHVPGNNAQNPFLADHDVRFKIYTTKQLSDKDMLYKTITSGGDTPPVFLDQDGSVTVRKDLIGDLSDRVTFARNVTFRKVMHYHSTSKEYEISINSVLSGGSHQEGVNLTNRNPFLDLSLEVDTKILQEFLLGRCPKPILDKWISEVVEHSIMVSDSLSNYNNSQ